MRGIARQSVRPPQQSTGKKKETAVCCSRGAARPTLPALSFPFLSSPRRLVGARKSEVELVKAGGGVRASRLIADLASRLLSPYGRRR